MKGNVTKVFFSFGVALYSTVGLWEDKWMKIAGFIVGTVMFIAGIYFFNFFAKNDSDKLRSEDFEREMRRSRKQIKKKNKNDSSII